MILFDMINDHHYADYAADVTMTQSLFKSKNEFSMFQISPQQQNINPIYSHNSQYKTLLDYDYFNIPLIRLRKHLKVHNV